MLVSHSTRVRGLKYLLAPGARDQFAVALYTSAWIEICPGRVFPQTYSVALYTSAWIEMESATL